MRDLQVYGAVQQCLPTATGINGTTNFNASSCAGGQLCFDIIQDSDPGDTPDHDQRYPGRNLYLAADVCRLEPAVGSWRCSSPALHLYGYVRDNALCPPNGVSDLLPVLFLVGGLNSGYVSTPSVTCFGDLDGSASASANSVSALQLPVVYNRHQLPASPVLAPVPTPVTITDGAGCAGTALSPSPSGSQLSVTASGTTSSCTGGAGRTTAVVTGGTPQV